MPRFATALPGRLALLVVAFGTVVAAQPAPPAAAIDPALYQNMRWRNIGPLRGGRSIAASGVVFR